MSSSGPIELQLRQRNCSRLPEVCLLRSLSADIVADGCHPAFRYQLVATLRAGLAVTGRAGSEKAAGGSEETDSPAPEGSARPADYFAALISFSSSQSFA